MSGDLVDFAWINPEIKDLIESGCRNCNHREWLVYNMCEYAQVSQLNITTQAISFKK